MARKVPGFGISAAMQALLACLPRSSSPTSSLRLLKTQQALIANAGLGSACGASDGCRAAWPGHQWSGLAMAVTASCCSLPNSLAGCAQLAPLVMEGAAVRFLPAHLVPGHAE